MSMSAKTAPPDVSPLRRTLRWPVLRHCLAIMVLVGTLLNLINQWEAILAWQDIDWVKAGLTYCVPFLVSLYGAYSAIRTFQR